MERLVVEDDDLGPRSGSRGRRMPRRQGREQEDDIALLQIGGDMAWRSAAAVQRVRAREIHVPRAPAFDDRRAEQLREGDEMVHGARAPPDLFGYDEGTC